MNEEFTYELRTPKPAGDLYPAGFAPLWWSLAALAAIALVVLLVRLWLRRVKPFDASAARRAAYQEAVAALDALLAQAPNLATDALGISQILRRYLWRATGDRLWFETSEEFMQRAGALANLQEANRTEVVVLLRQFDTWKYSAASGGAQPWRDEARGLLDRLHHAMGA